MFNNYLLATKDNKQSLYLYLDNNYEFSKDIESNNNNNNKKDNIYNRVNDYIKSNNINYKNNKVNFIKNGIIVGSIDLSDYDFNNDRYVEVLGPYSNKFISNDKSYELIKRVKIDELLINMACSIPVYFNIEAVKAIIIALRTDIYNKMSNNTNINVLSKISDYKRVWKDDFNKYYDMFFKAIYDTDNKVIMYNNELIDVYYHLSSNNKTEDAINVLEKKYPYLISVDSDTNIKYTNFKIISNNYLSKLLDTKISENTKVKVLLKTSGNRIKYIKFNDKVFDGIDLATRLDLNSNCYDVSIGENDTLFTTYGYGNGLGLSMYGANNLANKGYNYLEILHHYYPNTYIEEIII